MHTAQQLQWQNFGQTHERHHISRLYVSFVSYSKKNDRDISRARCTGLKYRIRAAIVNFTHVLNFLMKYVYDFVLLVLSSAPFGPWEKFTNIPRSCFIGIGSIVPPPPKRNCRIYAYGEQWYIICSSLKTNVSKTNTCLPWQEAVNAIIFSYP